MSILLDFKTGGALKRDQLVMVPPAVQAMPFIDAPVKIFAPGVTLQEHLFLDEYIGTADALVDAGLIKTGQFPGQPGMRKVSVTIFPDGTLPTGAPTANNSLAKEPGAKQIRKASKTTFSVRVRVTNLIKTLRWNATENCPAVPHSMPSIAISSSTAQHLAQTHNNFVSLQAVRTARQRAITAKQVEQRAPINNSEQRMTDTLGDERRLLWVSSAEAQFLSDMYQHGAKAAAQRLLQDAQLTGGA